MSSKKISRLCSRIISSCENVPEIFKDGFKYSCLDYDNFPFSVCISEKDEDEERYIQLIALTEEGLFIFDMKNSGVRLTQYGYDNLILIKKTNSKDLSTIFVEGIIGERLFQSRIVFNNEDMYIFNVLLENMRLRGNIPETEQDHKEHNAYDLLKLGSLRHSDPRLYNYAAESLLQHSAVKTIIFQKKLVHRTLKVIKKSLSKPHVMILTDDELIIIEEGRANRKMPELNIEGSWYFIPIVNITSIEIVANDNYTLTFTVMLKGNEEVKLVYDSTMRIQLEELVRGAHTIYRQR